MYVFRFAYNVLKSHVDIPLPPTFVWTVDQTTNTIDPELIENMFTPVLLSFPHVGCSLAYAYPGHLMCSQ